MSILYKNAMNNITGKIIIFILSLIYWNDDVEFNHSCKHRKYKVTTMLSGNKRKVCIRCGEVFD